MKFPKLALLSIRALLAVLAALMISFTTLMSAHAQAVMLPPIVPPVAIGPFFTVGASGSAGDVADGTKTGYLFAFSAGAEGIIPFDQNIGLSLGLAYESRGLNYHTQADENVGYDYKCTYLSIRPEFKFKAFLIGLGVGVPLGINGTSVGSGPSPTIPDQNTLIEARVGGIFPLMESESGLFNLLITAAYPLTRIAAQSLSSTNIAPLAPVARNNGPIASVQIGLNYLFNLSTPGH